MSDQLEGSLDQIIDSLQRQKSEQTALGYTRLEIDLDSSDGYLDAWLYGWRMETVQEVAQREAANARYAAVREENERRQLAALKAKYD